MAYVSFKYYKKNNLTESCQRSLIHNVWLACAFLLTMGKNERGACHDDMREGLVMMI